jgi:hypothetical protein
MRDDIGSANPVDQTCSIQGLEHWARCPAQDKKSARRLHPLNNAPKRVQRCCIHIASVLHPQDENPGQHTDTFGCILHFFGG